MPGFDDELDALLEGDGGPSESAPRMQQTRRTVLDEVRVEGDPTGRRGRTVMGRGGRVETGAEVDADAPIDAPPSSRVTLPMQTIEGDSPESMRRAQARQYDQEGQTHSPLWDALVSPMSPGAAQRTGGRLSRMWDRFTTDPVGSAGSAAAGAMQGLSGGLADEVMGLALSSTIMGPQDPAEGMQVIRQGRESLRGRNPDAYGAGEVIGAGASIAATPSLPASRVPGVVGSMSRIASGAGTGALYGAAAGVGHSDPSTMRQGTEAALDGALVGGALGAGAGALGEAGRAGMGALERAGRGRDEALLAATGHAGVNRAAVANFEFGDSPRQVAASRARAAQVLRETDAVPRVAGMRDTAESVSGALQRTTDTMQDVRTAMGTAGPTGQDVARRLRERAASMRGVSDAPMREVLLDFAERYGDDVAEGSRSSSEAIPYDDLMGELRGLRRQGAWRTRAGRDVSLREEGLRIVDDAIRDSYDDALESTLAQRSRGGYRGGPQLSDEQIQAAERLGMDPVQAYRRSRLEHAVLRRADENAQRGLAATAGNRGMGFTEQVLGGAGTAAGATIGSTLGPGGAAAGATVGGFGGVAAGRALRATEPRLRASGAELAYRIAQTAPERLGRHARAVIDAGNRGSSALTATVHTLAQRDAEFRQELERAMSEDDDDTTPEAIRRIGESYDDGGFQ